MRVVRDAGFRVHESSGPSVDDFAHGFRYACRRIESAPTRRGAHAQLLATRRLCVRQWQAKLDGAMRSLVLETEMVSCAVSFVTGQARAARPLEHRRCGHPRNACKRQRHVAARLPEMALEVKVRSSCAATCM